MPPPDMVEELQRAMVGGEEHLFAQIPLMITSIIRDRAWEQRQDKHGEPFRSFEALVTHRLWQGLESSVDDLLAFCRKEPEVQALIRGAVSQQPTHSDAGKKGGRGKKAGSNTTGFSDRGATYTLRRLKRDMPELAERVARGELSANAAAIAAGFREKSVQLAKDPERAAKAIIVARGVDYAELLAVQLVKQIEKL